MKWGFGYWSQHSCERGPSAHRVRNCDAPNIIEDSWVGGNGEEMGIRLLVAAMMSPCCPETHRENCG